MPRFLAPFFLSGISLCSFLLLEASSVEAQVVRPARPKEYEVEIRYQIFASPNQRLVQFAEMTKYLDSIGFQKNEGPETEAEDPNETRMTGVLPSAKVSRLFFERHVKSILLKPSGYKSPEESDKSVKVQIVLASGFPLERQRLLADQVKGRLSLLGFREFVGYDNRGHTRLLGMIPYGNVRNLLKDLRGEPSGWLVPIVPSEEIPVPLRTVSPILITEILPETDGATPFREGPGVFQPPVGQESLLKIAPDLRNLASQEGEGKLQRVEVLLTYSPGPADVRWKEVLQATGDTISVEGRMGACVTLLASSKQLSALAQSEIVSTVRTPRPAGTAGQEDRFPFAEVLKTRGWDKLPHSGRYGQEIRIALIGQDFRGWESLKVNQKDAKVQLVDLTVERKETLEPDEFRTEPGKAGPGTRAARSVLAALPEAYLTLVRMDPSSPYQMSKIARAVNGEGYRSESLDRRAEQLALERTALEQRRAQLAAERREVLDNFSQEKDVLERRDVYFKKQAQFDKDELDNRHREDRYIDLLKGLQDLQKIKIVLSSLAWNDGYPLEGRSPLSRYLSETSPRSPLWIQGIEDTTGQVWSGLYHDTDGNGALEFTALEEKPKKGRWTTELNFLAWKPTNKPVTPDLPAKSRIHISVQWTEAHDPDLSQGRDDFYREPLTNLTLTLLRQRDPSGTVLPQDELEVVAQSDRLPQRLDNRSNSATYEQSLDIDLDAGGRYALRVQGRSPNGMRPEKTPSLPNQPTWELKPRIFVEVADPETKKEGNVVFLDYVSGPKSRGIPGDSRHLAVVEP